MKDSESTYRYYKEDSWTGDILENLELRKKYGFKLAVDFDVYREFKVMEVIDTTGCGDSYHAGFVCDYMLHGDIVEAMRCGSMHAARTLGHFGGFLY